MTVSASRDERLAVLLVEDQPFDAQMVKAWLSRPGGGGQFDLTVAGSLANALAALEAGPFDVVLLDLWLGDSNGLETLLQIRSRTAAPVVIISGASDEELSVHAVKAGAQDYIVKGRGDGDTLRRAIRYAVERHRLEDQRRTAEVVFNHTDTGIMVLDRTRRIQRVNEAFSRMTGFAADEVIGRAPEDLRQEVGADPLPAEAWPGVERDGAWEGEAWNRRRGGEIWPEWLRINAIRTDGGPATGHVLLFTDITLRKRAEEELVMQATRDALTGLPNRQQFRRVLLDRMARSSEARRLALLFIDLDGFKAINDTMGHAAGDQVLIEVGRRLRAAVRAGDEVARFAGDEFVVILPDLNHPADAAAVAAKIVASLSAPMRFETGDANISASIGIAVHPGDAHDGDSLVEAADVAMFAVKRSGKSGFRFFAEVIETEAPVV
ncbi:MAG: diguanylate cyclase [Alphaproteobacteria bacterium]|nr:diguanylate cyclase [Alphaproteobacteria bacterium]